jgi:copper chaperone
MLATIEMKVTGMTCQHCVAAVTDSIKALDPDASVSVDLSAGDILVETEQSAHAVAAAIAEAGYSASVPR